LHANETVSVETVRLVRELATAVSLDSVIGATVVESQVGAPGNWYGVRFGCCGRRQPESAAEVRQRSERWTGNVLLGVSRA